MKRSYTKNIIRTIKGSLSRFLAIFAIVGLGVGFLAGLMASPGDMRISADSYYDDENIYDIRLVSTLGLTDDDLEAVSAVEGVEAVLPVYDTDLIYLTSDGDTRTTRVMTLPEEGDPEINSAQLLSGRMPEKAGECVVVMMKSIVESRDWIGEELILDKDEDDPEGLPSVLKVVGTVKSAMFLSMEREHTNVGSGSLELILYTPAESFDLDCYTGFYVTVSGAKELDTFGSVYEEKTDAVSDIFEALGDDRCDIRYDEVITEAREKLDEAKQEYNDKKAEADEKLADAEKEIEDAEKEIADNEQKLIDAQKEIDDGQKELADGKNELADGKKKYEDSKKEADRKLADAKKQLDDAEKEIAENEKKLNDGKKELEDGWKELSDGKAEFEEQTESAQKQIDDGYKAIRSYQSRIDAGMEQLRALDDLKKQLDETEAQLDALDAGKASFWQAASAMGIPSDDRSDDATVAAIDLLPPAAGAQFAPLKAGLLALKAQGTDTQTARASLTAGKAQYEAQAPAAEAARAELQQGQAELNRQKAELDKKAEEFETKKAETQRELDEAEQKLNDAQKEYDDGVKQLEDGKKELEDGKKEYNDSKSEADRKLRSAKKELDDAEKEIAESEQKLKDAQEEVDDGWKELSDGKKELEDGRKEYEDSKKEAEEKLADAEEQIKDAESKIRDIEDCQWYVFTRDDNAGYSSYDSNADKIAAIATVFPLFFFLVSALVALTTMTRMVEEERQQVGTLKALGYSPLSIAAKYIIYAATASVSGSIFGLLIGMRIFPYIIINAYNIMYDIPKAITPFNTFYAVVSSSAAILCTLAATLSACWAELKEVPASLMLPKAPKAGRRVFLEYITPLWSRMKFTHKVTARNLLRYTKRFFMTVIGISGCTALLVTGFGVKDSISHICTLEFNEIYQYDLLVALKDADALDGRDFKAILNDKDEITGYLPVLQDSGKVVPTEDDPNDDVIIFAPEDVNALTDFISFRHRQDSVPVTVDGSSVIITEKLSERQHIKVGDVITVKNQDEKKASFTVTDICENYVYNYLYISPEAYEAAFGDKAEWNSVLCRLPTDENRRLLNPDTGELSTKLLECRDVAGLQFTSEISESFATSIDSLNSIVLVLIISAGALAFIVLYNLTNINISERIKEIATIKVLGFYNREVSEYIYRENAVLTIIGDAVGLVLGVFLHQFVIRTAEIDIVMFGRSVYPLSFVWSALLTILFSVLVNLVMHQKLKKISMVESMKAPE